MIVQDKKLLDNLVLLKEANSLREAGFINKEQLSFIKKELPVFRSNKNILARFCFFLLGLFLYLSICGVISLFALSGIGLFFNICCFIFAGIGFAGAEILAQRKYHSHGLDDAFILGIILNSGIGIAILTDGYELIIAISVAIVSFIMYKRYLHVLSMLIFCCSFSAVLFYGMFEFGTIGRTILPFVLMLISAVFYFNTKSLNKKSNEDYYHEGILVANSFCLVLFYLSGNYLVVSELSMLFLYSEIAFEQDIPFAYFFYVFTLIVPVVYLLQALKTRNRVMLWISFLAIGFSIYAVRVYYWVLPIEILMTLGGLFLFVVTYFSIKKLKNKEAGLTFKPDRINNSNDFLNAEALIVTSTFGMKPEVTSQDSPMDFGGGGFSGGGSGGSF